MVLIDTFFLHVVVLFKHIHVNLFKHVHVHVFKDGYFESVEILLFPWIL